MWSGEKGEIFLFACWDLESIVFWGHVSKFLSPAIGARKHSHVKRKLKFPLVLHADDLEL